MISLTQIGALVGTVTGVVSLAWNIHVKVTAGPKLRVSAHAGMVEMPSDTPDKEFMCIKVQNIGTTPTTLTNYCFVRYESRWKRVRGRPGYQAIINSYRGSQTPHKLEVGAEAVIFMQHNDKFDTMLEQHDIWVEVHHSFAEKPARTKIITV